MVKQPFFDPNHDEDYYGQFKWKEINLDPRDLDTFEAPDKSHSEEDSIIHEARSHARKLLFIRLLELAEDGFTDHQKRVFGLMRRGNTYQQIADMLGENYSSERSGYTSIAYAIKGIKSKQHGKHHGGIERKLRKLCLRDLECQKILKDLKRLEKNDVEIALSYLKEFDEWYAEYDERRDKDE